MNLVTRCGLLVACFGGFAALLTRVRLIVLCLLGVGFMRFVRCYVMFGLVYGDLCLVSVVGYSEL